jgi:hypothetical protein
MVNWYAKNTYTLFTYTKNYDERQIENGERQNGLKSKVVNGIFWLFSLWLLTFDFNTVY